MAWSEKLPNGTYRGCWRDATGAKRSATADDQGKKFTQKKVATNYAIYREGKARDDAPQLDTTKATWGQWCDRWLEIRRVEPSTARSDRGRLNAHLWPRWGDVKLSRITSTDVQVWINQLADRDDLSPATVQRILHLLSASMKAAVRAGRLASNPCTGITAPSAGAAKERFLTKAEFWAIHTYLNQPYNDAAVLLAYTGLRFGELAGLHWSRVNLDQKMLTVAETWDSAAGRVKGYPKSRKPRHVPLAAEAVDVLMARPPDIGMCGLAHTSGPTCSSSLVITSTTGLMPIDSSAMRRAFETALESAGIGHARLHDLRHTFGSWLAQAGIPVGMIQAIMGHASLVTTQKYTHFAPAQFGQVIAALGDD